ncbi:tyrosine-type recombinase/integrase [Megalodesulfovibrio paquesii]
MVGLSSPSSTSRSFPYASHVFTRGGGYYFRLRLPSQSGQLLGKKELRYSLQTPYLREAKQKAQRLFQVFQRFEAKYLCNGATGMDRFALNKMLRNFFLETLERDEEDRRERKPAPPDAIDDALEIHSLFSSEYRENLARSDYRGVEHVANRIMTENGLNPDTERSIQRYLAREVLKLFIPMTEIMEAREVGDYREESLAIHRVLMAYPDRDRMQPSASSSARDEQQDKPLSSSPLLSQAVSRYMVSTQHSSAPATTRKYTSVFKTLLSIVGDKPIEDISRADIDGFWEKLRRLPKNYSKSKELKHLPLHEAIEKNKGATISTSTFDDQATIVKQLFKWLYDNQDISSNPTASFKLPKRRAAASSEREMFSDTDVAAIFEGGNYLDGVEPRKGTYHTNRFWTPLIAAFTGMRINEICQLRVDDLEDIEGILCFKVTGSGEGQSLKTESSRRIIPLHHVLIEKLFLPKRFSLLKEQGHTHLFPLLTPRDGDYADSTGKWFGRYKEHKAGIASKQKVFHSFRHTFTTKLARAGVELNTIDLLTGHAQLGQTAGRYLKGLEPLQLKEAIERLHYKGLDLTALVDSKWNNELLKQP